MAGQILALCSRSPGSHWGQAKYAEQKAVVTYCKGINIFGSFYGNQLKYPTFLWKQMDTNPSQAVSTLAWK